MLGDMLLSVMPEFRMFAGIADLRIMHPLALRMNFVSSSILQLLDECFLVWLKNTTMNSPN
jgi:hypothetical protein